MSSGQVACAQVPPAGVCFRYWADGSCKKPACAYAHVREPPELQEPAKRPPQEGTCPTCYNRLSDSKKVCLKCAAPRGVCFRFWHHGSPLLHQLLALTHEARV